MKEKVTKQEFYSVINMLDVIPSPQGIYNDDYGYKTIWKTRNHNIIGESNGGNNPQYFLIKQSWRA